MSSWELLAAGTVRGATIVPHRTLPDTRIDPPIDPSIAGAVRCPRCHELVALPDWANDGDLTECSGLLVRVSCDARGCQLERL